MTSDDYFVIAILEMCTGAMQEVWEVKTNELTWEKLKLSLIHISEPTRQAEISYAVFCLKKKNK